jgi:hypothetical protein
MPNWLGLSTFAMKKPYQGLNAVPTRDDASPEQTFLSDAVSATKIVER